MRTQSMNAEHGKFFTFSQLRKSCCSATRVIASEKLIKMNIVGCRRGKKVIKDVRMYRR